jgi:hypothetical protein
MYHQTIWDWVGYEKHYVRLAFEFRTDRSMIGIFLLVTYYVRFHQEITQKNMRKTKAAGVANVVS